MKRFLLSIALLIVSCSDDNTTDCLCTITTSDDAMKSINLGCGGMGCLGSTLYGCDESGAIPLGACPSYDLAPSDGGNCLPEQASCNPAVDSCCGVFLDASVLGPTCDVLSRRCCVPAGQSCSDSTDCCQGHVCSAIGDGKQCSN
jgi:hypothetical protein